MILLISTSQVVRVIGGSHWAWTGQVIFDDEEEE
jgi:hypothetical protein